jgi:hypothetical protein
MNSRVIRATSHSCCNVTAYGINCDSRYMRWYTSPEDPTWDSGIRRCVLGKMQQSCDPNMEAGLP